MSDLSLDSATLRSHRGLIGGWILFILVVFLMMGPASTTHSQTPGSDEIINPVIPQRADPWVYRHADGYYYFTASVPDYDRIELRRATTIQGLASASPVVIWQRHTWGVMSYHIWAPEIHYIDDKWYIYFAAARTDAPFDHRIYVLENESANPLEGTWSEREQLVTNWESFSLDATTFEHEGVRYLVWAQREPGIRGNSNLYIAAMSNPWTISGNQVRITVPEYEWEQIGFWVNEGPAVLKRSGRIFITYSASATDANYAMGLLTASDDSDLLDPDSWGKSPVPVFQTSRATGQYGPGHSSFTTSPDGEDMLIYHARNYEDIVGDPLYDPNRHTRTQVIYWNSDGTPNFGIPVPDGPLPSRFRSYSIETHIIYSDEGRMIIDTDRSDVEHSQFRVVVGLADSDAVSFEAVALPGHYLRHRDGELWLEANDDTAAFAADATWHQQPGLADSVGVSFESYNVPHHYIRHRDNLLYLSAIEAETDNADATFLVEH